MMERERVLRRIPDMPAKAQDKAQERATERSTLFERMVWQAARASILVVDDVAENRDLLVRRLKRLGIDDIEQATNGLEALAAIERKAFHLVLLDIMMPELDGFGVLEHLKADGRINDLPVVVISALSEIEPVVRCIELGAEDFIFKPFNPTLLRARVMATLEKKFLRDSTRDDLRRKQAELDEARALQLTLAPPDFHGAVNGQMVSIEVLLEPAKEVGGDLVDHFRIGDRFVVLVLGDVSDKGAGAALMMARTHALIRSLAVRPDAEALFVQPEKAVGLINATLAEGNSGNVFVTFLLATIDLVEQRISYVRAGHIPPFLRRAAGSVERLKAPGGLPLGLGEHVSYKSSTVAIEPGDRVLVVTDGYTEAVDPAGALFGDARVEAFVAAMRPDDAAPLRALTNEMRAFEAGLPAADDTAAILLSLGPADGG
jgi:phosphoserine phosphatase RsbU/P